MAVDLTFSIPAWSGSDRKSLVSHPKVYFFDLGVRNALLRRPLDTPLDDERGFLLEHLIAYEIHRRLGALWPEAAVYYYRTRHGSEVDFVIQLGRELWAIEVKSAGRLTSKARRGLDAFADREPEVKRRIVVYLGTRKQKWDNVEVLPLMEFLRQLPG